jgi:hypothetical protein
LAKISRRINNQLFFNKNSDHKKSSVFYHYHTHTRKHTK